MTKQNHSSVFYYHILYYHSIPLELSVMRLNPLSTVKSISDLGKQSSANAFELTL